MNSILSFPSFFSRASRHPHTHTHTHTHTYTQYIHALAIPTAMVDMVIINTNFLLFLFNNHSCNSGLIFGIFQALFHAELILEQHRFKLHGSTYIWIFFSVSIVYLFSFYKSLNSLSMGGSLCSIRDHNMWH